MRHSASIRDKVNGKKPGFEKKERIARSKGLANKNMITIDNKIAARSQELSEKEIEILIQEEKEWLQTMEEERKKDEADPNVIVKQSYLLSLKEENNSMKLQLKQYETFFRAMYDNMMEARKKAEENKPKPKMVGNVKVYE